jgi:hypothetical protein
MAAYVATERIVRARPRFVGSALGWSGRDAVTVGTEWVARTVPTEDRPLDGRLRDALDQFREGWAQTTFFLFDPNSWR